LCGYFSYQDIYLFEWYIGVAPRVIFKRCVQDWTMCSKMIIILG
jgi:hypothetical protein